MTTSNSNIRGAAALLLALLILSLQDVAVKWIGGDYPVLEIVVVRSLVALPLAKASVVAPFEYAPLLINLMWGFLIWGEVPTLAMWIGASLTIFSGLYILYRGQETREGVAQISGTSYHTGE